MLYFLPRTQRDDPCDGTNACSYLESETSSKESGSDGCHNNGDDGGEDRDIDIEDDDDLDVVTASTSRYLALATRKLLTRLAQPDVIENRNKASTHEACGRKRVLFRV